MFFFVIFALLILGPFRRPFFRLWPFTIPATLGAYIGWKVMSSAMKPWEPWWCAAFVAIFVGLGAGIACLEFFGGFIGKEK